MDITPILKKIPALSELNEVDHKEIIKNISLKVYPKGSVVFNEGDEGDALYLIKKGKISIFKKMPDGQEKEIAYVGDNDFFGEMALVSAQPRSATAMAAEASQVFILKKDDFYLLLAQNPGMASRISDEFMRRTNENLRKKL